MESRRDRLPSTFHQQAQVNQSNALKFVNNVIPIEAAGHNSGHSVENSRQASVDSTASYISNNSITSSLVNHIDFYDQKSFSTQAQYDDSIFIQSGNFHPQFKQNKYSGVSQTQQNLKGDLLDPTLQTLLESDLPMISNSGNLDPSFYVNGENLANNSLNLGQLSMNSPYNHSNLSSTYLQPKFSPAHQSPNLSPSHFQSSPNELRHNSLRTESAGLFHRGNPHELDLIGSQFQGHRRSPSEYSDVSTSSVQLSPDTRIHDLSEIIPSPIQNPQNCSLYQDVLGIGNFSLSDPLAQHVHSPRSPARSPDSSPQSNSRQNSLLAPYDSGIQKRFTQSESIFPQESFPPLNHDMGLAPQMVPPEINVEFAPPSRPNCFDPPKPLQIDQDALTPPEKARRRRAFTDTTNGNSIPTPRSRSRSSVSSSFDSNSIKTRSNRSLSPNDDPGTISPSRIRRQSTPSMPNRDYILSLADPEYQATTETGNPRRVKKQYPATYQCSRCTKKFTRAYNLRSHLRTHTDERPFTCSVCNKAFARQHDRKRHEDLHSGERRFVCKGELKPSGEWGCGRRFARADALGRHFRSEAGRVCIHPLLEEEARERQRARNEQQAQNVYNMQPPLQMDPNCYSILPNALLAQYPALATLSWSALPQGDVGKEDEPSGRSSFDASGSEYYDEGDEDGYISSGPTSQQYV
ncbi:C2H2 finger domain transcription factor [Podosphaera aphanis]|nr:C2H2 finger domain transcription factor [Podosphaera aphanis]